MSLDTYVLKKIKDPLSLYAKRLQVVAPVIGSYFAYDCQAGDWVKPHGSGEVKDLIFKVTVLRDTEKYTDYHHELVMTFSNREDGFMRFKQDQKSLLKSPYQAPSKVEYEKHLSYFKKREPDKGAQTNADPLGILIARRFARFVVGREPWGLVGWLGDEETASIFGSG